MNSNAAKKSRKQGKNQRWIPLTKTISATETNSPLSSGRASPVLGHPMHSKSLTQLDEEAARLILLGVKKEDSRPTTPTGKPPSRTNSITGAPFSKMSLTSIMPSFTGLSRTRSNTNEDNRGRRGKKDKRDPSTSRDPSMVRSMSPFRRRDRSLSVEALRQNQSDVDSDGDSVHQSIRTPRNAFNERGSPSDSEEEEEEWDDVLEKETEGNTERNAAIAPLDSEDVLDLGPDPLGEGVNIVRALEPLFPQQPIMTRRKRPVKSDAVPLVTAAPHFQKDTCAVTLTHGKPLLHCIGRPTRKYMVASDLSEESKYAVEWGIGTVLKDGDEMVIVTVSETDVKLDNAGTADRLAKLRNQQERQALAYLLVKQATALLQRTRLNVTVKCQAIHSKNARHALLDFTDIYQPIMLIVGSRGIGKLKGILLGSTSHYLIQKSSVPVMVARRRLRRAVRHSQTPSRTKHVSLAEATIEKVGQGGAEKNVQQIRDEIAEEEASRQKVGIAATLSPMSPISPAMGAGIRGADDSDSENESEDEEVEGVKVPGDS